LIVPSPIGDGEAQSFDASRQSNPKVWADPLYACRLGAAKSDGGTV